MSLALALLFALPSFADDRAEAEHTRISGDMEQLAERQVWSGVEKKFLELEKVEIEPTYADLMHGAYAARALGDMSTAYARLKRAAKVDSTKEVIDWLYAIDMNYGSVELTATPPRNIELTVASMPFDPDQRVAVEKAVEVVGAKGGYTGLLPRGEYTFAGQSFKVEPGLSVRIEVSPKLKKTTGITVNVQTTPTWGSGTDVPSPEAPAPAPQR